MCTVSAAASAEGKKLGSAARENIEWKPASIDNIVKAMMQNIDNQELQAQGCLALKNLADGNDDNRVEIAKQGGIAGLVKALVQHPDNAGVQEQGCLALLSLACNDANRVEICKEVGIGAVVTLCSARNLPHMSSYSFVDVVYKDKTLKSTVQKKSLDPDWKPEEKFVFDLSSGELADIEIQLTHGNMMSSAKLLGRTVIGVNMLKRLLACDKAAFPSDEFLITAPLTAPDGKPLTGKDQKQAHLVLEVVLVIDKAAADAKVVILNSITVCRCEEYEYSVFQVTWKPNLGFLLGFANQGSLCACRGCCAIRGRHIKHVSTLRDPRPSHVGRCAI